MRKMAGIVLAVGVVFVVAGCAPPEHNVWFKRGVGVKMDQAVKGLKSCAMKEEFIFDAKAKGGPKRPFRIVLYAKQFRFVHDGQGLQEEENDEISCEGACGELAVEAR